MWCQLAFHSKFPLHISHEISLHFKELAFHRKFPPKERTQVLTKDKQILVLHSVFLHHSHDISPFSHFCDMAARIQCKFSLPAHFTCNFSPFLKTGISYSMWHQKWHYYYTGTGVSYQKSNLTSNRPMSTIHENTFKFKIGWKQNINEQLKDWVW